MSTTQSASRFLSVDAAKIASNFAIYLRSLSESHENDHKNSFSML